MSALQGHVSLLLRSAFTNRLASQNSDATGSSIMLAVWNTKTGQKIPFPNGTGSNSSVPRASGRYSKDGQYLLVGGRGVDFLRVYNAETLTYLKGKDYSAFSVAIDCRAVDISPNNQFIAVGSASAISGSAFHVFNFADMSEVTLGTAWAGGSPLSIRFSPNGLLCAIANQGSNLLTVYETTTWTRVTTGITPSTINYVAEFSPDSAHLVVGTGTTPFFLVYSTATWALLKTPTGSEIPGAIPRGCAFSLDGQTMGLTTETSAPFVKLYDVVPNYTLKSLQPTLTNIVGARGISFNRAGTELAIGHNSNSQPSAITRIRLSDMTTLTPIIGGSTNSDWVAYNR